MKLKKRPDDNGDEKKAVICILAAIMICILAIPSFAANGNDTAEAGENTEIIQTDDAAEVPGEDEAAEDQEDVPENDAEQITDGEEINDEAEDEGADADIDLETEEAPVVKEAPVMLRASSGDTVSYTAKREGDAAGETTVFKVKNDGKTYTGACAEQGVAMKSSGKAKISKIENNKKIAKVVYHYAIELGKKNWWDSADKTDKVGKIIGMEHSYDTNVTKQRMVEVFCQIYNMGSTDWYNTVTSSSGGGWSKTTADKVRDYYRDIDTSGITVPDSFEIWFAKSDNSAQPFIMWTYTPYGYASVTKESGNIDITG